MKKTKLPSLVSILILTMITVIAWISLSVYKAFTTTPPESVPSPISNPLTPTLDQNTIQKIESGIFVNESDIPESVASKTTQSTPTRTPATVQSTPAPEMTPVASPSAAPTP